MDDEFDDDFEEFMGSIDEMEEESESQDQDAREEFQEMMETSGLDHHE